MSGKMSACMSEQARASVNPPLHECTRMRAHAHRHSTPRCWLVGCVVCAGVTDKRVKLNSELLGTCTSACSVLDGAQNRRLDSVALVCITRSS